MSFPRPVPARLESFGEKFAADKVPIIGQPRFDVSLITVLATVTCGCGKGQPLTLVTQTDGRAWTGVPLQCGGCQQVYTVQNAGTSPTGQFGVGVDVKTPDQMRAIARPQADAAVSADPPMELPETVHG